MSINISFKQKYNINGKEYNSLEEMPDDVRETFKKMSALAGQKHQTDAAAMQKNIICNSAKYESLEALPQEARALYETALKTAKSGAAPEMDLAQITLGIRRETEPLGTAHPGLAPQPSRFEYSFSMRSLIVSIVLGALLLLFYYLWSSK